MNPNDLIGFARDFGNRIGDSLMKTLSHGKSYVYTVHGCRCALCTEAWKLQMRKYRAKPGKLQAHAWRAVVKRYGQKYAGHPDALMVALVSYQYNPRKAR